MAKWIELTEEAPVAAQDAWFAALPDEDPQDDDPRLIEDAGALCDAWAGEWVYAISPGIAAAWEGLAEEWIPYYDAEFFG